MKSIVVLILSLVMGFSSLIGLQHQIDDWRGNQEADSEILYIPSGKYVKLAVLGYDNLATDILWIRGILLFGDMYHRSKDPAWYQFFYRIVDVCTDLVPYEPQFFIKGGLLLRDEPTVQKESTLIFEKGIDSTDHFFIPMAVGMNAIEFEEDYEKAAKYFQIAAKRPKAPFYLSRLAATLMSKTGGQQAAYVFLQEQLKQTPPGTLNYKATTLKLREIQYQILQSNLTEARSKFQSLFSRDPEPLSEMLGIVIRANALPPDPYGGEWFYNSETGAIKSNARDRVLVQQLEDEGIGYNPYFLHDKDLGKDEADNRDEADSKDESDKEETPVPASDTP